MIDRESTNILSNGAVRYGVYDSNGNLLRYEYIKLEDEPTVEGSLYNKENVLPDSVCNLLHISVYSEPKDAFSKIRNMTMQASGSTYEKFVMRRCF